ncbi:porin family protein [Asticcacaulis sp. 201]|uniref:porin family protein n=1 Tax=Asticcacaulis sp. 201 TaxID=3028787 RepID=UPI002916789A|nr:porin family protein [Asticcacaulis sp. 201]MDV6333087.1 porin family protein [Asticcacaulis sp. 201]
MKTFLIATAAVATLAIGTAASAQDVGHVYGSLGYQQTDNDKTDTKLGSVNARVGTKITPHFGVEGEAAFGTDDDNTAAGRTKLTNKVGVYGVGYLPVSSSFDLIGRVGVSDTNLKSPAVNGKYEQGTALDYGVGAQYHINPEYAVRADYTRSDFQSDKGTANTATISLVKAF